MLNSLQVNSDKKAEKDEKDVGFTVIRVESSVSSQAAQDDNKDNNDDIKEGAAAVTPGDKILNNNNEEVDKKETASEASEVTTTVAEVDASFVTDTTKDFPTTQTEDIRLVTSNEYCILYLPDDQSIFIFI